MLQQLKKRLFSNRAKQFDPTGIRIESLLPGELEGELHQMSLSILRKAGVDPTCLVLDVEQVAQACSARPSFRIMVAMVRWDPRSTLRLLLGIAHIERGMRRSFAHSWARESCEFAGIWLHPTDSLLESASLRHLASALSNIDGGLGMSGDSTWDPTTAPLSDTSPASDPAYAPTIPSKLTDR